MSDERWLVVFDNVDDPTLLNDYLPTGRNGSILLTSRDPESQYELAHQGYKVECFDEDEGGGFILAMLPPVNGASNSVREAAKELSRQLGGLALGIKQLGGFIRETGISTDDLLELLNDKDEQRLLLEDQSGFSKLGYSHTVASLMELLLARLDTNSYNILGLFSFLDPDHIPAALVRALEAAFADYTDLFPKKGNRIM